MAGSLQGPAAAASLDRTPYGKSSAGGKIRSSRHHHHHQNSHLQEQQHRNSLRDAGSGGAAAAAAGVASTPVRRGPYDRPSSGRHASAIVPRRSLGSRILTGASSFLSSLLFRRHPVEDRPLEDVNERAVVSTGASEDVAIEDILKDRVFTREQCDRFIKVLQSKLGEQPQPEVPLSNGVIDDRYPDEELERELERDTERRRPPADETISMEDEPGTSPIDIAKAYMDKRLSPVPSALPVRTLEYTPVRLREELPRVATPGHTPYVRLRPGKMYDTGIRPSPYPVRNSSVREKKRPVEDDSDYTGRRTRLKITKGPPLSTLPSSSNAFGNGSYLDRMRNLQKKRVERKHTEEAMVPVPAQSSETARKILETLEILTPPKVKTLEQELTMVREKRPKELSPSMLNDQARKTLQAIDFPAPEPRAEPEKRAADEPEKAQESRPPAAVDLKGKAVNTSPEAAAGPSVKAAPSGSRGFRMNAVLEESNSDEEGQLIFSKPAPKPVFPFASSSTSSPISLVAASASAITTTAVPVVFTSPALEVSKATIPVAPASSAGVVTTTAMPVMFPLATATSPAAVSEASPAFPFSPSAITSSNASVSSTPARASPIVSFPSTLASVISTRVSESSTGLTGAATSSPPAPETKAPVLKDSPATGFSFVSPATGALGLQSSSTGLQLPPFGSTPFFPATGTATMLESKPVVSTILSPASGGSPGTSVLKADDNKADDKLPFINSGETQSVAVTKSIPEPAPVVSSEGTGMPDGLPEAAPREAKKPAFAFGTESAPASSPLPASGSTFTFVGGTGFAPLSSPNSTAATASAATTTTTTPALPQSSGVFPSPDSSLQFPFSASSSANNAPPFTLGATSSFTAAGASSPFVFNATTTTPPAPSSNAAAGAASIFGTGAAGSTPNPFSGFASTPASSPFAGAGNGNGGDMDMGEDPSTAAAPSFSSGAPFVFGNPQAPAAVPAPSASNFIGSNPFVNPGAPAASIFGPPHAAAAATAPGALPFGSNPNPFGSAPAFGSTSAFGTSPAFPPFNPQAPATVFGAPQGAGSQGQSLFNLGTDGDPKPRKIFRAKRTGAAKRGGK